MQRFKAGDRALILPKFAALYPDSTGVVVSGTADPFRAAFNEYILEFPKGTRASVFEFQIVPDYPEYQLSVGTISFDTQKHVSPKAGKDGADRHLILKTDNIIVDLRIRFEKHGPSILGHIYENPSTRFISSADISLLKEGTTIQKATTNKFGTFRFDRVPTGMLNIDVLIPSHLVRFLCTFSIYLL
jgi:hypothetical protein